MKRYFVKWTCTAVVEEADDEELTPDEIIESAVYDLKYYLDADPLGAGTFRIDKEDDKARTITLYVTAKGGTDEAVADYLYSLYELDQDDPEAPDIEVVGITLPGEEE